ncbi:hypothetical protein PENTCL1PPCAC_13117, partial [Pristionchus entomophagus]
VLGLLINLLLLFLIAHCGKGHLGNYRSLLKIFACNDIAMMVVHAIVQPAAFSAGSALGIFSNTFPEDKYIIAIACAWFTVPFTLMNINFLHRFWSVRRYCACFSLADNPIGKEILNRTEALAIEGIAIGDGWLVLHFWVRRRAMHFTFAV